MFFSNNHTHDSCVEKRARTDASPTISTIHPLYLVVTITLSSMAWGEEPAQPQEEVYNTTFFQGGASVDLHTLLSTHRVLPGKYRVDLYSNDVLVGRRDIEFAPNAHNGKVEPCMTVDLIQQLGVDLQKLQD